MHVACRADRLAAQHSAAEAGSRVTGVRVSPQRDSAQPRSPNRCWPFGTPTEGAKRRREERLIMAAVSDRRCEAPEGGAFDDGCGTPTEGAKRRREERSSTVSAPRTEPAFGVVQ